MAVNLNKPGTINQYKPGTPQLPGAQRTGSGFTNLQRYIQSNQNVGQKIGQQAVQPTAGRVQQQTQQTRQAVETKIAPEEQRYQQAGTTVQQALQDPTQFAADQSNVDRFAQYRKGEVGYDPSAVGQQTQQLAQGQDVSNLQQMGQLAQSGAGRFQLLKQAVSSPQYTSGQQKLDALILSQRPEAQALKQAVQPVATQTASQAQTTASELAGRLQGLESQRADIQRQIAEGLGSEGGMDQEGSGALGEFVKNINQRVEEENKARANVTGEIKDYLTRGKEWADLSDEAKSILSGQPVSIPGQPVGDLGEGVQQKATTDKQQTGGIAEPGIHRFGAEAKDLPKIQAMLKKYISQGKDVTKEQLAKPEELAKYEALNKLAGKEGEYIKRENVEKADKLDARANLDIQGLNDAQKSAFMSELETPTRQWATEWDIINGARYNHKEGRDAVNHILTADPAFKTYMQQKFGMAPNEVDEAVLSSKLIGHFAGAENNPSLLKLMNAARSVGGVGNMNQIADLFPNLAINYVYNAKYLPQFQQVANRYGANPNADFHNVTMGLRGAGNLANLEEQTKFYENL